MNARIILFCLSFLLPGLLNANSKIDSKEQLVPQTDLRLYVEPDFYDLSKVWVDRFSNENPSQVIHLIKSEIPQINKGSEDENRICIFSESQSQEALKAYSWKMILGQEVLVPIMNSNNPLVAEIRAKGVSMNGLKRLAENPDQLSWSGIVAVNSSSSLQVFASDNGFVVEALSRLAGHKLSGGVNMVSSEVLIRKVQTDQNAIGFCTLSSLSKAGGEKMPEGISFVPIDKNGNGKLDYVENIYGDLQSFSRGVWIGKYPKTFCSSIYAAANGQPISANEVAFLKWLLTDGQQFLDESGYSELTYAGRQSQLAKIDTPEELSPVPVERASNLPGLIIFWVVCVVVLVVVIELVYSRPKRKSARAQKLVASVMPFDVKSLDMPQGYYFDKTYTWAFLRKNGTVKIGLDDFVMHLTGDVTKVEMKSVGEKIKKGEPVCSIVNKGRVLNFYSPISGTITEYNKSLGETPSLLRKSPYSEGWIYIVQPLNWSLENQYLSLGEVYRNWVAKEFSRLMDFIATSIKGADSMEFSQVVLQDGGLLRENFLDDLDPKIWEDFQTEFIDTSK